MLERVNLCGLLNIARLGNNKTIYDGAICLPFFSSVLDRMIYALVHGQLIFTILVISSFCFVLVGVFA